MKERYKADVWGSSAWAVFAAKDIDADLPLMIVYGKEAAADLCRAMNRAAEERLGESAKQERRPRGYHAAAGSARSQGNGHRSS